MMYVNPFTTYSESPESVQVFVGVMLLVVLVVGGILVTVEIVCKWWDSRKK